LIDPPPRPARIGRIKSAAMIGARPHGGRNNDLDSTTVAHNRRMTLDEFALRFNPANAYWALEDRESADAVTLFLTI
jgi:hypothetical protein